mgnify:FL=1
MVMDNAQPIITTIRIQQGGVKPTSDRNGRPQWELTVFWEWTPSTNSWGDKIWVYQDSVPEGIITQKPDGSYDATGNYTVTVERGELKKDRDGQFFDGTHNWMYKYRIISWDASPRTQPAPAPAAPAAPVQTPVQAPYIEPVMEGEAPVINYSERELLIVRQVAFKAAIEVSVASVSDDGDIYPDVIAQLTDTYTSIILNEYTQGNDMDMAV